MTKYSLINNKYHDVELIPQKGILSFKEALIYLDISKSSLYKLTSDRAITHSKPNGGKLYFKKSDLDDWMTQNELKSTQVLEKEINNRFKKRIDGKRFN